MLVGLRPQNIPTNEEKAFLHNYIFQNYGGHTPEEIVLAFEMAIQHKLDIPANEVKCYENFSIAYFSNIMEAYRVWAKEQVKQLPAPPPPPITDLQKAIISLEYAFLKIQLVNKFPCKVRLTPLTQ